MVCQHPTGVWNLCVRFLLFIWFGFSGFRLNEWQPPNTERYNKCEENVGRCMDLKALFIPWKNECVGKRNMNRQHLFAIVDTNIRSFWFLPLKNEKLHNSISSSSQGLFDAMCTKDSIRPIVNSEHNTHDYQQIQELETLCLVFVRLSLFLFLGRTDTFGLYIIKYHSLTTWKWRKISNRFPLTSRLNRNAEKKIRPQLQYSFTTVHY